MKPFYCRIGTKSKIADALIQMFPVHETYVEPFFGGGAIFWRKDPSRVEVLNDLDSALIEDYNLLRHAPPFSSKYPILTSMTAMERLLQTAQDPTGEDCRGPLPTLQWILGQTRHWESL